MASPAERLALDLATLIGLIGVVGVLVGAIMSGDADPLTFVNVPSILIVLGGTLMATLIKFQLKDVLGAFRVGLRALLARFEPPAKLITAAVELAAIARKQGLLALDEHPIDNAFLKRGIQLLVDGNEEDVVQRVLTQDIDLMIARHERGESIFRAIGDVAPAMGMIGTLVGLVQMLSNMADPQSIGPAMAVALLTTLYGAVIANAFALPVADKLANRSVEERLNKLLIVEGVNCIQRGLNPRVIEEMLKTYLPDSQRDALTVTEAPK